MKFTDVQRWVICALLAGALIGVAIFQLVTGITLNPTFMKYFELAVLVGVLYFLVLYPKKQRAAEEAEALEEEYQLEEELENE